MKAAPLSEWFYQPVDGRSVPSVTVKAEVADITDRRAIEGYNFSQVLVLVGCSLSTYCSELRRSRAKLDAYIIPEAGILYVPYTLHIACRTSEEEQLFRIDFGR